MKISFTNEFLVLLNEQIIYISKDKPKAAKKFKKELLLNLNKDLKFPYNYKKSIYFNNIEIRDYIFKGYTIVYEVSEEQQKVTVFEFIKYMETL